MTDIHWDKHRSTFSRAFFRGLSDWRLYVFVIIALAWNWQIGVHWDDVFWLFAGWLLAGPGDDPK